jgi:hypothetical protein
MMEAVCTSQMSLYYNKTTKHNIPEGYYFQVQECSTIMRCFTFMSSEGWFVSSTELITIYYPVQNMSIFVYKLKVALNGYTVPLIQLGKNVYRLKRLNFTQFSIWTAEALYFSLVHINVSDVRVQLFLKNAHETEK